MRKPVTWKTFSLATLVLLVPAALAGNVAWHRWMKFYQNSQSREFYRLVAASNQEVIDLRNFRPNEWDEIIYWPPYRDICSLGIRDYDKGSSNCSLTMDEGEAYLLFTYGNELAFKIPVHRKRIDFEFSKFRERVRRKNAVLLFQSKGDSPKVALAGQFDSEQLEWEYECTTNEGELVVQVPQVGDDQRGNLLFHDSEGRHITLKAARRYTFGEWSYTGSDFHLELWIHAIGSGLGTKATLYDGQVRDPNRIKQQLYCANGLSSQTIEKRIQRFMEKRRTLIRNKRK